MFQISPTVKKPGSFPWLVVTLPCHSVAVPIIHRRHKVDSMGYLFFFKEMKLKDIERMTDGF